MRITACLPACVRAILPHPLPLWQAAAAVVLGHLPLLIQPRLLTVAEMITLIGILLLSGFLTGKGILFIRLVIGIIIITNCQINNTLFRYLPETRHPDNIDVIIRDAIIETSPVYSVTGQLSRINGKKVSGAVYINIKTKGLFRPACAGEVWRIFRPALRPVHYQLNAGLPDRQQQAVAQRRLFTLTPGRSEKISGNCAWRQRVISHYQPALRDYTTGGLMTALLFGERSGIPPEQRRQVQETGVAHVVAISGLHIGLAALWGWWGGRLLLLFLPLRLITPRIPAICSLCTALFYVWLAGFAVPATRALIVLLLWHLMTWRHYHLPAWQFTLISAALLLLIDPLTILSASFLLSYGAVAALLFWHHTGRGPAEAQPLTRWGKYRRAVRQFLSYQWGLFLLLSPAQAVFFGGFNPLSLLSNLWVLPIVSFLSVPLLFLGFVTDVLLPATPLTGVIPGLADASLRLALLPLPWLSSFWSETGYLSPLWIAMVWGALYLLRLALWQQHPVLLPGMLICCFLWLRKPPPPDWSVTLLDIGHGLAVVVERAGRAVIYDTGNRFGGRNDGDRVIIPYLRHRQLTPDQIVISHDHRDHTGGLAALRQRYPAAVVRGNIAQADIPCERGERWFWQSIYFEVLWPDENHQHSKNNGSCVLRLSLGKHQVLLTGDIEKEAEIQLVKRYGIQPVTLLQVPHHGSRTSSTDVFIRAVNPVYALVSVARYSPWQLPSDTVRRRYHHYGTHWQETARSGQLAVRFSGDNASLVTSRPHHFPRWYSAWFGDSPVNG